MESCIEALEEMHKGKRTECSRDDFRKAGSPCLFGLHNSVYEDRPNGGVRCKIPEGSVENRNFQCPHFGLLTTGNYRVPSLEVPLHAGTIKNVSALCTQKILNVLNGQSFRLSEQGYNQFNENLKRYASKHIGCGHSIGTYCFEGSKEGAELNRVNSGRQASVCRALADIGKAVDRLDPTTDGSSSHNVKSTDAVW
jgi:hypothetical protein